MKLILFSDKSRVFVRAISRKLMEHVEHSELGIIENKKSKTLIQKTYSLVLQTRNKT